MFGHPRTKLRAPVMRVVVAACLGLTICGVGKCDDLTREKEDARKLVDELTLEISKSKEPNPDLYEERGDAFMALDNFDRAFDDYSKAIEIAAVRRPTYPLLQKRVTAAIKKGDYRQALADTQEVTRTRVSPPQAAPFAMLALILARSPDEKVKNAKASLDAALLAARIDEERRAEVLVQLALAAAYSVNGDFEAAVTHQEKAIAAVKGKVPLEMKAQLDAYKARKEYPFQKSIPH